MQSLFAKKNVSRYFYQKGRINATLQFDKQLKEAIKVLEEKKRYDNILAGTFDK